MPHFPTDRPSSRKSRVLTWATGAIVLALSGLAPVAAQTRDDVDRARAEREQVREEALAVAASIDALGDEAGDLVTKLDLLAVTVAAVESRLTVANEAVAVTRAQLDAVEAEIADLEAARAEMRALLVDAAVSQYIAGHEAQQGTVLTTDDPVAWSLRKGVYRLVVTDAATANDQLRVIEARLTEAHTEAAALASDAQLEQDEASLLSAELVAVQVEQVEVLGKVQERLDRRLAEADALARIDQDLSEEIRRGEAEIARRLAIAEALDRMDRAGEDGSSRKELIARPDEIVNVRGIEIHYTLADQLLGLINHAEADGIILGGAGWRSTEHQIELRMKNCGGSDYLIFDAPSEACFPPTARPATSNHEAGRAVDFTANGAAIVDRNSPGFQWLAANAATYGFYNLWSEPWHWSDDGR